MNIDVLLTWGNVAVRLGPGHACVARVRRLQLHGPPPVAPCLEHGHGVQHHAPENGQPHGIRLHVFGMLVLVFVLVRYAVAGGGAPGFPFLASIIAIFSGAQLFAIGMIGEYLARMHFRLMDQPAYVVRGTTLSAHERIAK